MYLQTLYPEKKERIVHIHAESGKSLSSVQWVNYDVLIHTGVFESAINFQVRHFDGIIGFATGGKMIINLFRHNHRKSMDANVMEM